MPWPLILREAYRGPVLAARWPITGKLSVHNSRESLPYSALVLKHQIGGSVGTLEHVRGWFLAQRDLLVVDFSKSVDVIWP